MRRLVGVKDGVFVGVSVTVGVGVFVGVSVIVGVGVGVGERERQGVGVCLRGLEACLQSIDMAGKGGVLPNGVS